MNNCNEKTKCKQFKIRNSKIESMRYIRSTMAATTTIVEDNELRIFLVPDLSDAKVALKYYRHNYIVKLN